MGGQNFGDIEIEGYFTFDSTKALRIPLEIGTPQDEDKTFQLYLDGELTDEWTVSFSNNISKTPLEVEYDCYLGCDMTGYLQAAQRPFDLAGIQLDWKPDEMNMQWDGVTETYIDINGDTNIVAKNGILVFDERVDFIRAHKKILQDPQPSSCCKAYLASVRWRGQIINDEGDIALLSGSGVAVTNNVNVSGCIIYQKQANLQSFNWIIAHELGHHLGLSNEGDYCSEESLTCLMRSSNATRTIQFVKYHTVHNPFFCTRMLEHLREKHSDFRM